MTKIILNGCGGKMGRAVSAAVAARQDCEISCGVDISGAKNGDYPVFTDINKAHGDVIIDFSHPSALRGILEFAVKNGIPAVIATTGLSENDIGNIKEAAKKIPVFFSFNMSLGINLLSSLCVMASKVLGDGFDVEIVERHHGQKLDAPSGTAVMLADSINKANDGKYEYEYDRHSRRETRPHNEIGIHSVRGGNIVGDHEVIFAGHDEVITLSHSAYSKEVFAVGAVNAALFINGKAPGLYDMAELVKSR